MGIRKKQMADAIKADKKQVAFAKLNNCPTSPRKMRLVADLVRGQKAEKALQILRFSPKKLLAVLKSFTFCNCQLAS